MLVGVIGFQGSVAEHLKMLRSCGARTVEIRAPEELEGIDALIIPGGESTHLSMELDESGLTPRVSELLRAGMPVFGTCAGAILLSKSVGGKAGKFPLLGAEIERNAYGRQAESFEAEIEVLGLGAFPGVFIRAPVFRSAGKARVLASFRGKPVLLRQRGVLAATFHPELSGDRRLHEFFLRIAGAQ